MSKVCEACQLGKQARHPFPVQTTHGSFKPLEMIHSDVWTMKIESIGGCKYYVSFINVTTLALGLRPRQRGYKGYGPRRSPKVKAEGSPGIKARRRSSGVTSHTPMSVRKCEGV
jgi:hypothetical protein